ncbi:Tetratricopeptide repeat-containing protein [Cellulosimicrobium aquatile]|uniref:Tetratricopeptide repeat-containing protein n=1 Tax=Cellulosimicrobium aquatile TaxID=1612203 RepID=A0A1N6Q0Y3_9MICO|nr:tetratricopeptide repeat protein [Cellulosimicrobium aquatile]SIQ10185.1 Tetratricopeptide repeat-containing protein [Cellulosimicrobium aquatile]
MPTTDQGADVAPRSGAPAEAAASALADLRSAVGHLHPDDPAELVAIADDLRALGSPAAAVPFYEAAVEQGVPGAVYRLGVAHHEAGDAAEAFRCFELAGLAGDALGAFMAAQVAAERGDLHAARRWYELAQGVEGAAVRLAQVLAELGERDAADDVLAATSGESWEAAVELVRSGALTPDDAVALLEGWAGTGEARVAATLADLYVRAGRGPDAEDLLEQAALAGEPTARTSLGVLRLRAGRVAEAMALWHEAAAQGDPQAAELLARFG